MNALRCNFLRCNSFGVIFIELWSGDEFKWNLIASFQSMNNRLLFKQRNELEMNEKMMKFHCGRQRWLLISRAALLVPLLLLRLWHRLMNIWLRQRLSSARFQRAAAAFIIWSRNNGRFHLNFIVVVLCRNRSTDSILGTCHWTMCRFMDVNLTCFARNSEESL